MRKSRPELTDVLSALADPVRLAIVRQAAAGEFSCGEFCQRLPKATLSHHFKVLHQAGVIKVRVAGTRHFVGLDRAGLDKKFPGLLKSVLAASKG